MSRRTLVGLALLASGLLTSCDAPPGTEAEPQEHQEPRDEPEHGHEPASSWVEVRTPTDATLLQAPATVVAAPEARSRLAVPYLATVVEIPVRAGDRIETGDPVLELAVPALLEAAAALGGADAQIDTHRRRKDRVDALLDQGLVGAADAFELEARLGELSAERRQALATFRAAGVDPRRRGEVLRRGTMILRSPVTGVVADLAVSPGMVVEPGSPLATVLGRAPARVRVTHREGLPEGLELTFEGGDGSRFALRPEPVATAIEPGLGRTLAWYEPADGAPRPDGLRGRVVAQADRDDLCEVPRDALRLHEGRAWVARRSVTGSAEPEPVEVEVLRSTGTSALVRSDQLRAGDSIAIDAATVLAVGRDPDELGEGHHH